MSTTHVMLDLETLGTKPGCPILSIGASTFNHTAIDSGAFFNQTIHLGQALMDNPDEDTVSWWKEQSEEARLEVFNNSNSIHIIDALITFSNWLMSFKIIPEDRVILWGNGATFDEPILLEAYKRYNIPPVWTFRDALCFRTLKELGKLLGVQEPTFTGVRHNALADAAHQAKWADKILQKMQIS